MGGAHGCAIIILAVAENLKGCVVSCCVRTVEFCRVLFRSGVCKRDRLEQDIYLLVGCIYYFYNEGRADHIAVFFMLVPPFVQYKQARALTLAGEVLGLWATCMQASCFKTHGAEGRGSKFLHASAAAHPGYVHVQ